MLDEEQRNQVKELIEAHDANRRLSSGQKWDVAVLLASFLGGAVALLGVAGYFVIENAAKLSAASVAAADVAEKLVERPGFTNQVANAVGETPAGLVAAFDLAEGCPSGWSEFASARGRTIIGATAQGEEPGSLTVRRFQEFGGAETHTLTQEQAALADHSHGLAFLDAREVVATTGEPGPRIAVIAADWVPFDSIVSGANPEHGTVELGHDASEPHNNMPPYIALYFCKKEAG